MDKEMCPECGSVCYRDEVDIGVGIQYGPIHCTNCCWPKQHKWTGKQMGGPPDMAESTEWVGYCDVCGIEKKD